MNFIEFEETMAKLGLNSLAEIARYLKTTPQAVSNWKSRDQVPNHIIIKVKEFEINLNQGVSVNSPHLSSNFLPVSNYSVHNEEFFSLTDILLVFSEQLKLILLIPFIAAFLAFTHAQFIKKPQYISSVRILVPGNQQGNSNLSGLASQFGVGVASSTAVDLSSPTLLPELIKSRTFAERLLNKVFTTQKFGEPLPLISILTNRNSNDVENIDDETVQKAMSILNGKVSFKSEGELSTISVKTFEPIFARDLNKAILEELQALNRFYKSQNVQEKVSFIESRIAAVNQDLQKSENMLESFREKNQQISSPSLQIELDRLSRDLEVQKSIYLTLKQQLELAKIEEIQQSSVLQIIDQPQVPIYSTGNNLISSVIMSAFLGLVIATVLAFIRSFIKNSNSYEQRKLLRVRNYLVSKTKDFFADKRITGIISLILILGLPYYLGHRSEHPVFFGRYSLKLMIVNTFYLLILALFSLSFFYNLILKKHKQ